MDPLARTEAERIFREALCLDPSLRDSFAREASSGNPEILNDVRMLLLGHAEAGGDDATPTIGNATNARAQWAAMSEEPGSEIHHFRLVKRIGEGGMGTVWEAEQTSPIQRKVALKVIKLGMDTREIVGRFERERSTLALMDHPSIARIIEAGATPQGRPFFAMELVHGEPITRYCKSRSLNLTERLSLFLEICHAVQHAHQKGVIHRDLKPSNLLASENGVKIIDFGVARFLSNKSSDPLFTRQAQILGTPVYMSPEQAASDGKDIDTRTDVYSLGIVLYELICGSLPFDTKTLSSSGSTPLGQILLEADPPRPSTRIPDSNHHPVRKSEASGDLDWIVMKAISKDRNRRYTGAAALAKDIQRFLDHEMVDAVPPTFAYRSSKFIRRHHLAITMAAVILIAITTALIVSLRQTQRANLALIAEASARRQATFTVADMYTRSGLTAADSGDPTRASLWFAHAALIAKDDPDRRNDNALRAALWRNEAATAVRAFDTGFPHIESLSWHPELKAIIAPSTNLDSTQIWNLENEQRWIPHIPFSFAAWSPSGDHVALVLENTDLAILSYPAAKEIARLPKYGARNLTWSPDGKQIATANILWNWQSNTTLRIPTHPYKTTYSPDGRLILLQFANDVTTCLSANPSRFLHPPTPGTRAILLGDGSSYASCLESGSLVIRDSNSGALIESHTTPISYQSQGIPISASPDGRFIARTDLPVLDRQNPGKTQYPIHRGQFIAASFHPAGNLLASGGYDNRLELWNLENGTPLGEIGHHHTAPVNVAFSPDGTHIASGQDGLVRIWKLQRPPPSLPIHTGGTSLAALSPCGKFLLPSGFTNQRATLDQTRLHSLSDGKPAGPTIHPGGLIMDAVIAHDSSWIALAISTTPVRSDEAFASNPGSGNIQIWNPHTATRIGNPIPMPSEPRGIALHPDGATLGVICAGVDGLEISITDQSVKTLFNEGSNLNAGATLNNGRCSYSPDGSTFASWGTFQYCHLWNRKQQRLLHPPNLDDSNAFDISFHQNTVTRAMVASHMRVEFLDLTNGKTSSPEIPYTNWPFLTRFHPDGTFLLTAGGAETAQVWKWPESTLACPALIHRGAIMAGTFLPQPNSVATGGHDGMIKFWNHQCGRETRPPIHLQTWIFDLQLSPNRDFLISSTFGPTPISILPLASLFPPAPTDLSTTCLLAEIDADAEIHPGGGLAPLTPKSWLAKWQTLRALHPHLHPAPSSP